MIVVSAGIIARSGRILLSQRRPDRALALKWEFPGGKVEKGESPQDALERELREELGIQTRTGRIYDSVFQHREGSDLLILFYHSSWISGEVSCLDCTDAVWAEPDRMLQYDLAEADRGVAERLCADENLPVI